MAEWARNPSKDVVCEHCGGNHFGWRCPCDSSVGLCVCGADDDDDDMDGGDCEISELDGAICQSRARRLTANPNRM